MEKLLTTEQVAELLQIHINVIRKWLKEGKLPGIKLGREWRVDPQDLEAFIQAAKSGGSSDEAKT